MAGAKQRRRELEKVISRQNKQAKEDLVAPTRERLVRETLTPAVTPVNRRAISSAYLIPGLLCPDDSE